MAAADEAGDGHQGARQRGGRGDISMRIHVGRVEARSISTLAIVPFFFFPHNMLGGITWRMIIFVYLNHIIHTRSWLKDTFFYFSVLSDCSIFSMLPDWILTSMSKQI